MQRRASGFALAIGFNLLLLFVLMGIGAFKPEKVRQMSGALVVDLLPESHDSASAKHKTVERPRPPTHPVPPPPKYVMPVKPTIVPQRPLPIVELTKDELAAADSALAAKSGASSGQGRAGDSEEVGRGPHGEVLYNAEWARHPTDAELGGYLPKNAPDGWGLIACRTVAGNRVEDCVELGNSPPGSHLASAVRQAAWQFRVRPPRKNGREMIGEWVRIRIDYEHVDGGSGE